MLRIILTGSVAVMLSFGTAQAEGVLVKGSTPCSLWASSRAAGTASVLEGYQQGLINGLALGSGKDFWMFPYPIEPEQVFYWMDQYCANNPLSSTITGSYAVFDERFGKGWNLQ